MPDILAHSRDALSIRCARRSSDGLGAGGTDMPVSVTVLESAARFSRLLTIVFPVKSEDRQFLGFTYLVALFKMQLRLSVVKGFANISQQVGRYLDPGQ